MPTSRQGLSRSNRVGILARSRTVGKGRVKEYRVYRYQTGYFVESYTEARHCSMQSGKNQLTEPPTRLSAGSLTWRTILSSDLTNKQINKLNNKLYGLSP